MLTHTYVKTYALMSAWASTTPHERSGCRHPCPAVHAHADDECAVPDCDEKLKSREECYSVTELPSKGPGERWVCWRHVRPDSGPLRT
jgi:hypothetical protein